MNDPRRHGGITLLTACLILASAGRAALGAFTPDDPYYTGPSQFQWYLDTIGMPDAWMISQGSTAVKVAVLDTGVISTTPDLAGRVLPAQSTAYIGIPPTTLLPPATDAELLASTPLRHGTWVASSFAMGTNNSIGGAGVGNFSILPIRITSNSGTTNPESVAAGIRLAADEGARVISISYALGIYGDVDQAAAYARGKGALVFMGGGNTNALELFAPDSPNIIFVSGSNQNDERWVGLNNQGSTWGNHIDLAAPADNILIADPTLGTGYGLIDGTSFSTPIAAGAAALAWSINPNLTPLEVESMLFSTALDIGPAGEDIFFGSGRLNVAGVASAALASIPEPATIVLVLCGAACCFVRARIMRSRRPTIPADRTEIQCLTTPRSSL